MRTILTKAQQAQFLSENWQLKTIKHKWSTRGYGSSRILDNEDQLLGRAGGCGYDRYGSALGDTVMGLFPDEVLKLARSKCRSGNKNRRTSKTYYGLIYNAERDTTYIDGACGSECVKRILNKIGFELNFITEVSNTQIYRMEPVGKHIRKYWDENR